MSAPLLLHVFPSFAIGGAQARFVALANRFGPAFRHAIIAMDGDVSCGGRLAGGVDASYPRAALRKGDTLGNLRAIRRILRDLRPDVLITSNWGSIEWAMANALPIVPHIHMEDGFGPEERERQLARRVWTRRLTLRRSLVMLPSRTLERIARSNWRLRPASLRYIPNGIDLTRFHPSGRVSRDSAADVVIGTVAALRPEKNVGRLIEAFALLRKDRPSSLLIAGDGPQRARLEALAREKGVNGDVRFLGNLEDPAPFYSELDIFALGSDTEQMPISVLEAMASGLPVASTDVGDVSLMVGEENGPLIKGRDAKALADQCARLVASAELRRALGAANRARVERDYSLDGMVRAHLALIDEARQASSPTK